MNKICIFLRSLIANIWFYLAQAVAYVFVILVGIFSRKACVVLWDKFFHPIIWKTMLFLCGIKVEVKGKEYVKQGYIYASKHESAFETFAYTAIIPNSIFILKKELTYLPLFGWGQALYGMIAVDRSAGSKAMKGMLRDAKKRVAEGRNIIIFPEGTRCKHGEVKGYKSGVLFLAEGLDMQIVPAALNTGLHWGKGAFLKYPGTVTFEFMPPMKVSDFASKKEFMEELEKRIESKCAELW
ncbi:MAG: 1-acyl-sn-glycerol-3-phosphate acyltransferase [Alphaproteobacteria bacterium]|nr:1-acyl-sn-glycerol-3-phosphate acyltransferase [Alphaproteobacteria bacterium]